MNILSIYIVYIVYLYLISTTGSRDYLINMLREKLSENESIRGFPPEVLNIYTSLLIKKYRLLDSYLGRLDYSKSL